MKIEKGAMDGAIFLEKMSIRSSCEQAAKRRETLRAVWSRTCEPLSKLSGLSSVSSGQLGQLCEHGAGFLNVMAEALNGQIDVAVF